MQEVADVEKYKTFKSYDEQIEFLTEKKGLIINDKENAINLLKKHSYFDLINGFDYKYLKRSIPDTVIHKILEIEKKNNFYTKGKSDLFAVLISLKFLLSNESFSELINEIDLAIKKLLSKTRQIQKPQLYKYMGFPENWEHISKIDLESIVEKTTQN